MGQVWWFGVGLVALACAALLCCFTGLVRRFSGF